jgi:hypothetical protein
VKIAHKVRILAEISRIHEQYSGFLAVALKTMPLFSAYFQRVELLKVPSLS